VQQDAEPQNKKLNIRTKKNILTEDQLNNKETSREKYKKDSTFLSAE
jgi:hypothetical protein